MSSVEASMAIKTTLGNLSALLLVSAVMVGCSDDKPGGNGTGNGNDAAVTTEGGGTPDTSTPQDDAAATPDAATPDAATPDGSSGGDGAVVDSGSSDAEAGAPPPKASSCSIVTDKKTPIPEPTGRLVYCGIDIGSKNVKISVVSVEKGKPNTIKDERQCKRNLGLGTLVFDSSSGTPLPLGDDAIGYLIETVKEFQAICTLDRGTLVGADATQWARDATNIKDVQAKVKAGAGIDVDVLTPDQEGQYGYVAATLDSAGHLSLDPGSNSFQVSWRLKNETAIGTVSVPLGYVRASANDVEPAADFASGRAAYVSDATQQLTDALAKLTPAMTLAAVKQLVTDGKLGKEIFVVGQDGSVDLVVRNKLKDTAGTWVSDQKTYDDLVAAQVFKVDPNYGTISADPFIPSELTTFLTSAIGPADFATLKKDPVKTIYGQKALVVPALLDLLIAQLGVDKVVLVPQEMVTGYILARLSPSPLHF